MSSRFFNKWTLLIGSLLIVFIVYLIFPVFFQHLWDLFFVYLSDTGLIKQFVDDQGLAIFGYIVAMQIIQVILFPLPGHIPTILAGFLSTYWGWFLGLSISLLGLTIGSILAFLIGRYYLRDWVIRHIADRYFQKFSQLTDGNGLWIIGLIYSIPGFPNDFLCYVLGTSRVPLWKYTLVVIIYRIPNVIILILFGFYVGTQQWWIVLGMITLFVGIAFLVYFNKRRIMEWVHKVAIK